MPAEFSRKVRLASQHGAQVLPAASYDDMVRILRILDLPCSWPIADNEVPVEASVKRTTALGSDHLWCIKDNERLHWLAGLARYSAVTPKLHPLHAVPRRSAPRMCAVGLPVAAPRRSAPRIRALVSLWRLYCNAPRMGAVAEPIAKLWGVAGARRR